MGINGKQIRPWVPPRRKLRRHARDLVQSFRASTPFSLRRFSLPRVGTNIVEILWNLEHLGIVAAATMRYKDRALPLWFGIGVVGGTFH